MFCLILNRTLGQSGKREKEKGRAGNPARRATYKCKWIFILGVVGGYSG